MPRKNKPSTDKRTRRALIDHLKLHGPTAAKDLATVLGVSAMAVRLHLYGLRDEKLVEGSAERRPVGRPVTLWRLTPAADRHFPDGHAELVVSFIDALEQNFDETEYARFLDGLAQAKTTKYRAALPKRASLQRRVEALAGLRSDEGYMAEVEQTEDGALLLIENHCPICVAASKCLQLCSIELQMFQTVLGPKVQVERKDHIQAGARRCVYRIEKVGRG